MNFMVAEPDCTVADLSALQHFWTEAQYLTLTNHSHRLIEFTDGCIEILPVPAYPTTPGDFAVPVPGIGRRRSRQWRESACRLAKPAWHLDFRDRGAATRDRSR